MDLKGKKVIILVEEMFNVWVTADERRIPVKIKSKVVIGSFVAELISAGNIPSALATRSGSMLIFDP
jgi:hypothetical protein